MSGIALWHVVYQSQIGLGTGFLEETWSRNMLNLMVTPITELEYVALPDSVKNLVRKQWTEIKDASGKVVAVQ